MGINSTIIPIYIKEMSPISVSGLTGCMNQTSINIGLIISFLFGLSFTNELQELNNF